MGDGVQNMFGKTTILTYTGKEVDLGDILPSDIDITDIAHALSRVCRFGGHTGPHYSVAQHSMQVSVLCPDEFKLEGLLHDAAEAYIGDITRPLKNLVRAVAGTALQEIEKKIELAIALHFNLTYPWPDAVKQADDACLHNEQANFFKRGQIVTKLTPVRPDDAESFFKAVFFEKSNARTRRRNQAKATTP